jgi:citrate synthase
MTDAAMAPKPKKSVALSGVVAGNTALCSVGRSGNDLHYRGYDILEIATTCEFEEIAHLLVHERLPNTRELAAYRRKLAGLRALPAALAHVLESLPASSQPMDVLRTGVSALGCVEPEQSGHSIDGARDLADRLLACAFPAFAALAAAPGRVGPGDAHIADSLRRARIQCLDVHGPCHCRYRFRPVFIDHRCHRRAARPEARRCQ